MRKQTGIISYLNKIQLINNLKKSGAVRYGVTTKRKRIIAYSLMSMSFGIAVFPNGLGFIFYPLGFMLLGLVGIELKIKKRLSDKVRLIKYKLGWF